MATGANTTPLGRLNPPKSVAISSSSSSLLKPSYMVQQHHIGPVQPQSHQQQQHSVHGRSHQDEQHHHQHHQQQQQHHQLQQQQHHQQQQQMMMMKNMSVPLSFKSMMSAGPPPPPPPLPPQHHSMQSAVIPPPTVATPSMLVLCSPPPPPPPPPPQHQHSSSSHHASSFVAHIKRELYDNDSNSNDSDLVSERERKRRRRSTRWATDDQEKAFIPGMPPVLPNNLSKSQEKAYLLQLQIEELSRRLRVGDLGILPNPEERSPSPEPIYNNEGKRLNTREYRTRKRLEDERHQLIQQMFDVNPEFKPPSDYKPPIVRVNDKVMIPQEEHPDINFVGLLIGPRGNTLKSMEKDTGAKIIIRGKGSVKEGKVGRKDGQLLPGEDEPLHAYVTANNLESVKKAVERIKEIIRQGVEVPEGQNDLRRMQLRELALLNGTLRENEGQMRCSNCGASSHKSWQCPDKPNVTNNVICSSCGGAGHIAKDCRDRRLSSMQSPQGFSSTTGMSGLSASGMGTQAEKSKIDEEYMSLMAELGEGPPPPIKSASGTNGGSHGGLFGGVGGHQRAICAGGSAAAPPQPNQSQAQQPPPALHFSSRFEAAGSSSGGRSMSQSVQPPWNQGHQQGKTSATQSSQVSWQQQMQQQQQPPPQQHGQYMGPPPGMMGQPPPPPGMQPPTHSSMSWMQQPATGVQGWQQHPSPVMAPTDYRTASVSHWAGFVGVPPPPPPPLPVHGQQQQQPSGIDLNALSQAAGLPSFLSAAPPPPPPRPPS